MGWLGDIEFHRPWLLLAATMAVPVFFLGIRPQARLIFSSLGILPARTATWRTRLSWLPDLLLAIAVVFLSLAVAGPRIADRSTKIRRDGIAIMMVVDTSGSMRALDLSQGTVERTRLQAVKDVFGEFVDGDDELSGRPDDAIGLISFARYADTRCPLTLDHKTLLDIMDSLEMAETRAENATNMGDAVALAVERLRRSKAASKVAIVLTDGVNNAGEETPLGAAALAFEYGVKIYAIGAGTTGNALIRVPMGRLPKGQKLDKTNSVLRQVDVQIDEGTLREMAKKTGGQYFHATDDVGLREVYKEIDRLERSEFEEERFRQYRELYRYGVAIGLLFAILGFVLRGTILRRLPC